jgi:hypothetical protein
MAEKKSVLQKIRESPVAQAIDKGIEATDKFLGPSGKAWLANGLDELRQAVALNNGQIQAGNNPGLWGTITTGEATAERMGGDKHEALQASYEVPQAETQKQQVAEPPSKEMVTIHGKDVPEMQAKETVHGKQQTAEQPEQMSTLDKLRGYAKDKAQEAEQQMEKQNERGGMEM